MNTGRFDNYDTLLFDCYGTLIDWESGILASIRPILESNNVNIPDNRILEMYARFEEDAEQGGYMTYRRILRTVLECFGKELSFSPSDDQLHSFSNSTLEWPAFDDSSDALKLLQRQYKLAVLSNIDDDLFAHSEKKLGIQFDAVFTAQRIKSYKPNRRNFEYAIKQLGGSTEPILHVAQSLFHDIAPASALGLKTVWINRRKDSGGFGATPPSDAIPDYEFADIASFAQATL